jgi:anti-sigma factor RsiW
MIEDTHVLELLPAYALDCLEAAEARPVAEHLRGCVICRNELMAFQAVAGKLALAVPNAGPSPDLKLRLLERIQGLSSTQPQPARRLFLQRLLPVAGIIGLLLIMGLAVSNSRLWQRLAQSEVLAGPLGMRAIALQNTSAAPSASGIVIVGADGLNGVLVVDHLPPLTSQREYQLWLMRDGARTSGAVFSVDESGYRGVRIESPESLLLYSEVEVTIEPSGGSSAPTGDPVLAGSLFNQ